ncbi:hypothetical protein ACP70R_008211 [Stipagrostis hirtigluma subsp. patula]
MVAHFRPGGRELVDRLLRPKLAGQPLAGDAARRFIVHDADAWSAHPAELANAYEPSSSPAPGQPRQVWYFFSPVHRHGSCRCRRVGCAGGGKVKGRWQQQRWEKQEEADGLVYEGRTYHVETGTASAPMSRPRPSGWVMVEYGIVPRDGGSQPQLVLCVMSRRSSRSSRYGAGNGSRG